MTAWAPHYIYDTNGRTSVRSFIFLSIVSVRGVHPMGERTAMLYRNLGGE